MLNRLLPLVLLTALAFPAQAGLFDDDEARKQIAEVRAQQDAKIAAVADKLDQLDSRSSQKLIDLTGQLSELGQQIAQLRGQLEVLTFNLQGLQKRQQDLYVDLDGRLRNIEEGKAKPASAGDEAHNAQLEADAATAYESAYNLYRDGKLKSAIDALGIVTSRYAATQAAPSALFWLGMAQAQTGSVGAAQISWRKLVDAYPEHAKSPDALRAIATVQLEKSDRKGATKTLKELIAAYPGSDAAKEAERQLKKF
ncbi:outer membrane protein assembly factor BamD [Chitinimonas arctica]|uniref:Cell division coordinator CpoB n=1 Tax=Chitinimonas arctica TaxID=2594795 RepID=A0A516SFM5_9NEIS|nr:YbgF trimerization domain-containing protein [Chitinimonas arctica]QDQ26959.1 outer membrane protein assembly factor BamD [Chitinimonas arctica]